MVNEILPFPLDALPTNLKQFTEAVAANVQVSPDMVAVPLLATLCAPLQTRYDVEIDSTYHEPLCLYTLTVAKPSERKSAIIKILSAPIWRIQKKMNEDRLPETTIPTTLYVTDATPEKLAYLMAENDGSITLISDEPDVLAVAAGLRYGKSKNLGLMLQAWGAGNLLITRATDKTRIVIDRATMSVAVMSQPSFVKNLLKDDEMSTRGFIQRFLFAAPPSLVGSRSFFNRPEIPKVLLDEYDYFFESFYDRPDFCSLHFDLDAWKWLDVYYQEVEKCIAAADEQKLFTEQGWLGKMFGQVIRLAGILHCAEWGARDASLRQISANCLQSAWKLGCYFQRQMSMLFAPEGTDAENDAARLLEKLYASDKASWTKSDIERMFNGWNAARRDDALTQLIKSGDLFKWEDGTAGRPRTNYTLTQSQPPKENLFEKAQ